MSTFTAVLIAVFVALGLISAIAAGHVLAQGRDGSLRFGVITCLAFAGAAVNIVRFLEML